MRRAALALFAVSLMTASAAALDVPYLSGRVNDDAHLFSASAAQDLERTLKTYEEKTGRQFVVLTIPSLGGEVLEEYSIKVARAWKLGRKDKNDGILLLVARDDHKVRIEVGYGLEGDLPDALCGRIIRDEIVPRFRGGDFAGGVTAGVEAVLAALSPPGSSPGRRGSRPAGRPLSPGLSVLLTLGLVWYWLHAAAQLVFSPRLAPAWINFLFKNFVASLFAAGRFGFHAFALLFFGGPVLLAAARWAASHTDGGRRFSLEAVREGTPMYLLSSTGSGFGGGGGSFGGGGASGSW